VLSLGTRLDVAGKDRLPFRIQTLRPRLPRECVPIRNSPVTRSSTKKKVFRFACTSNFRGLPLFNAGSDVPGHPGGAPAAFQESASQVSPPGSSI
jgi:hypothetical protein